MACTTWCVPALPIPFPLGGGTSPATRRRIASTAYGPALPASVCPIARSAWRATVHAPTQLPSAACPPRSRLFRWRCFSLRTRTAVTWRTASTRCLVGCSSASRTASHSPHMMCCDVAMRHPRVQPSRCPLVLARVVRRRNLGCRPVVRGSRCGQRGRAACWPSGALCAIRWLLSSQLWQLHLLPHLVRARGGLGRT